MYLEQKMEKALLVTMTVTNLQRSPQNPLVASWYLMDGNNLLHLTSFANDPQKSSFSHR